MKTRKLSGKKLALLISVILLLTVAVGGTAAYIATQTQNLTNVFKPGKMSIDIHEEVKPGEKSNVKVVNTGDAPAYVRVYVTVSWQNANGDILAEIPENGVDYNMTFIKDTDKWFLGSDGYYYYSEPLETESSGNPGYFTEGSLLECKTTEQIGEYSIAVNIMAQCIQADPQEAVTEAWTAVEVVDGKLQPKN